MLSVFAAIISKLREAMADKVPIIFEAVFECTLHMITKNFEVGPLPPAMHRPTLLGTQRAQCILTD